MYEPRLTRRDRAVTFAMVAGIHVALAFVLMRLAKPARKPEREKA